MAQPRLPAEWETQTSVMLTWPHAHGDWASRLTATEAVFVTIAAAVCRHQHLVVAAYDPAHRAHIERRLRQAGVAEARYRVGCAPSNDTWARDHGPIGVYRDGALELLDFGFNGWGGKYPAQLDDQISRQLHQHGLFGATPLRSVDLILEGGAVETDGLGGLLSTRRCLPAPTRNPGLSLPQIEQRLGEELGIQRFLWLDHGALEGDDTDSHIDTLARFCDPRTIAYVACDDPADPHYPELQAMAAQLAEFTQADGSPYRLVALPWPQAKHDEDGQRLPATYANFLIINGAVLVPTYRDPADARALAILAECFPRHAIIAVDCLPLIYQYGSLHCVTMQIPQSL